MCTLAAFNNPPLVQPELAFLEGQFLVKVCLDQPLFYCPNVGELLALCSEADTLVERVLRVGAGSANEAEASLASIEEFCLQIWPRLTPKAALESIGILEYFPYVERVLDGRRPDLVTMHPGVNYLNYISLLNQVVMMGTQLYHDACIPQHHKYIAHQIALLYQCLNMLQGDTKPIRRIIEARFEEVKIITESRNPYLPMEMADWLQEVTWLCREEVKACPAYVHKRIFPLLSSAK